MNRQDITDRVSTTLGDHTDSFDIGAIVGELADAGVKNSVDDVDSDLYWEIVRKHDSAA